MVSFIVPAHNEQAYLAGTLQAIHSAARSLGLRYEIVLVDDASTDATAEIGQQNNARVINVNHRQIAATRNSGGRAAQGDHLFFVDADTRVNANAVAAALRCMDKGAVGGGGPAWPDKNEMVPAYVRLLWVPAVILPKLIGFSGGAFMFCTREAFAATGGFDERVFWAEEALFVLALRREGRFVGLWERVITSGRRFRKISGLQILAGGIRILFSPFKFFTQRALVEKVWYDSDRSDDDKMPNSIAVHVSNAVAFVLLLMFMTQPVWALTPWSLTPLSGLLGKARFLFGSLLCHAGLLLWPVGMVLLVNFLRQQRWTGVIQSVALIAFLWWQAWSATQVVIGSWKLIGQWLI